MGYSRRDFLMRVGQAGGYSAAFATMQSLGLMPMKAQEARPIEAMAGVGKGVKIIVAGGGVAGLATALGLARAGGQAVVLDRDRLVTLQPERPAQQANRVGRPRSNHQISRFCLRR